MSSLGCPRWEATSRECCCPVPTTKLAQGHVLTKYLCVPAVGGEPAPHGKPASRLHGESKRQFVGSIVHNARSITGDKLPQAYRPPEGVQYEVMHEPMKFGFLGRLPRIARDHVGDRGPPRSRGSLPC